jgi:hypothetical protein
MSQSRRARSAPLVSLRSPQEPPRSEAAEDSGLRGFGGTVSGGRKPTRGGKGRRRRSGGLSAADWGPLGKHPDLEAIVARQRLHLPLSGRLTEAEVTLAWKSAAAEHHPDRGGAHDTMQAVNGARDLLRRREVRAPLAD